MDRILWPRKVLNKAFLKVKHNRSQRFKLKNQTKFSNKKKTKLSSNTLALESETDEMVYLLHV
jgi:hypothetical protein